MEGLEPGSSLRSLHLRVGSGGERMFLEISVYLRLFRGKQFFPFVSVSMPVAFGLVPICCSRRLCYSVIIALLSITL